MSGISKLKGGIEFQRRTWRAERIAWLLMALIIVAALLGAFGNGPLSRTAVSSGDGRVSAAYDFIQRRSSGSLIELDISSAVPSSGVLAVLANRVLLNDFRIEEIQPQPASAAFVPEGILWRFNAGGGTGGSVLLRVYGLQPGLKRVSISAGGSRIDLQIIVLP